MDKNERYDDNPESITIVHGGETINLSRSCTVVILVEDEPEMSCIIMNNREADQVFSTQKMSDPEFDELAERLVSSYFTVHELPSANQSYFNILEEVSAIVEKTVTLTMENGDKVAFSSEDTAVQRFANSPEKDFIVVSREDGVHYITRDVMPSFDDFVGKLEAAGVSVEVADEIDEGNQKVLEYIEVTMREGREAEGDKRLLDEEYVAEFAGTTLAEGQQILADSETIDDLFEAILGGSIDYTDDIRKDVAALRESIAENALNLAKKVIDQEDSSGISEVFAVLICNLHNVRKKRIGRYLEKNGIGYDDADFDKIQQSLLPNVIGIKRNYRDSDESDNKVCEYLAEETASKADGAQEAIRSIVERRHKANFEALMSDGQEAVMDELAKANKAIAELQEELSSLRKERNKEAEDNRYNTEAMIAELKALRKVIEKGLKDDQE